MADESDGVGETFDASLRIALTIASQFGERVARLREQMAREREGSAQQEARELTSRFDAERGAARASLAPVHQPEWWDQARPESIAEMHETATAWREFDDVAATAGDTIRREVDARYGIDVDAPRADTAAVAAALAQAERDRADAAAQREQAGLELTASQALFATADRHEREAQLEAENNAERLSSSPDIQEGIIGGRDDSGYDPFAGTDEATQASELGADEYDSSERRQAFAADLEGRGISQATIAARVLAEGENAKHPRAAVASTSGRAAKPRSKSKSSIQQRDRGGLSR